MKASVNPRPFVTWADVTSSCVSLGPQSLLEYPLGATLGMQRITPVGPACLRKLPTLSSGFNSMSYIVHQPEYLQKNSVNFFGLMIS